ncbi:MAG: hypothetical protein R3F59_19660 [Myxococcota bacterium]
MDRLRAEATRLRERAAALAASSLSPPPRRSSPRGTTRSGRDLDDEASRVEVGMLQALRLAEREARTRPSGRS